MKEASPLAAVRYADGGLAERLRARERMKNEPYYDAPLAMRTSRLLGAGFQQALDPKKKRFIKTDFPLNLKGEYYLPNTDDISPLAYPYTEENGRVISDILKPTADTVYSYGVEPSPITLAHEYRHRAGIDNEYINRLYDAMYAETADDWQNAVEMWRDQLLSDNGKKPSAPEADRLLRRALKFWEPTLREREWDMAPEDNKPSVSDPSFAGWLRHLFLSPRGEYVEGTRGSYEKFQPKSRGGLTSLRR